MTSQTLDRFSETSYATITQVVASKEEILRAMRFDCVTFFSVYIGEELTEAVPELHESIWQELLSAVEELNQYRAVQSLRKLFAVPRGFAKSTVAKLAVILLLKYTPFRFVLYASKSTGIAKNAIRDIVTWLNSDNEKQLFGPIQQIRSSENDGLWIYDIVVRDYSTGVVSVKRVTFKALGARSQVRGLLIDNQRPQIIIADDIEDLDNTATTELQAGLDEWFMGSFRKAFAQRHFILFIGNMIRSTSLLARLSKLPTWNPTIYGSIVRNKETGELESLWEDKHPLAGLLEEYKEYIAVGTRETWEAEMMNLTQDEILGESMGVLIRPPLPEPEDLEAGFIVLDPAYDEKATSDESAITVHARIVGYNVPIIIDHWTGRESEHGVFSQMLELSLRWGISTWIVESVAAQRLYISLFRLYLQNEGMNPDAFLILPIIGGQKSKAQRIVAFRNSLKSQSYGVVDSDDEIISRIQSYSPSSREHDDLQDSAAYGPIAWQSYSDVIRLHGISQTPMQTWIRDGEGSAELYHSELQVSGF